MGSLSCQWALERTHGGHHEWSGVLAKLPTMLADMLADAHWQVARCQWQGKYGRDPTDQQRPLLVNRILR